MKKHGLWYQIYSDDTQLYITLRLGGCDMLKRLFNCLNNIKYWMSSNFLTLIIRRKLTFLDLQLLLKMQLANQEQTIQCIKSICILFDPDLKFDKLINAFVCFFMVKHVLFQRFQDYNPCFYLFSPGLLQCTIFWSQSEPSPGTTCYLLHPHCYLEH